MKSHKYLGFLILTSFLGILLALNYINTTAINFPPTATGSHPVILAVDSEYHPNVQSSANDRVILSESTVELILDDGSIESAVGTSTGTLQLLFLNRFTPDPELYPFQLNQIRVVFPDAANVEVGDNILIVVYQDSDGTPENGAMYLAGYSSTIAGTDAWNIYNLPTPLEVSGPTDVLIGVITLEKPGDLYSPGALDRTVSQERSWIGYWLVSPPPYPPDLPPDSFNLMDSVGLPGNWMIRGYGETISKPTSTPTSTNTPTVTNTKTVESTATSTSTTTSTSTQTNTPTNTSTSSPLPQYERFLPFAPKLIPLSATPTPTHTNTVTPQTPTHTATITLTPTNTPTATATTTLIIPEPGYYSGEDPDVSFDVTSDQQVCNFEITVPFALIDKCHIHLTICMDITDNGFMINSSSLPNVFSITGIFDTQTHVLGEYTVIACDGTLAIPSSKGEWEASK